MTTTMTTTTRKLAVWAPATPGNAPVIVGTCDTMAEAWSIASRFESRRDLRRQDVEIRTTSGRLIGRCGPCR